MSKYVVVVFPEEAKAYEGTRALKELHAEGSLGVYAMAVIGTDASGKLSVKQTADTDPLGTGVGALVGGIVGLLGGPVGAAIGMSYGALVGGLSDIFNAGVGSDFVKAVSEKLSPGKTALVAEVDEDWVTPLNARMEALGGIVIREWRSDFEDAQIEKEVDARRAEFVQLTAEYERAAAENKAKLTAHMNDVRAKLQAAGERAKGRRQQLERETMAKVKQLQDRAAAAKADAKAKIDQQVATIQADYKRRSEKLDQAWALAKEAVAG
jgi:uncharacterized membrane protein